jgi:hypothetical protein
MKSYWSLMLKRLLALTLLQPVSAFAQDISKVSVLDQNFQLVKTLTSARDLAAFDELWSGKTVQESALGSGFLYKIDIHRGGRSVRWLYDPAGFLKVLSKSRTPVYGLSARQAFNRLLAIDSQ